MKPTNEEFLTGSSTWPGMHEGIRYKLLWHAYDAEYNPEGIWCWYLIINSEQFSPDLWETLRVLHHDGTVDYRAFPNLDAHGGWTYGYLETRNGVEYLTIGCNYAHPWDKALGWPQNLRRIETDAKRAIEKFVEVFPPYFKEPSE